MLKRALTSAALAAAIWSTPLAFAQVEAVLDEPVPEEAPTEGETSINSYQDALADHSSILEDPVSEEEKNPFADMIGMSEKELREKMGRPHTITKTVFGDESYFYNLKNDVLLVIIIRDKKVFRARAYQTTN